MTQGDLPERLLEHILFIEKNSELLYINMWYAQVYHIFYCNRTVITSVFTHFILRHSDVQGNGHGCQLQVLHFIMPKAERRKHGKD